MAERTNPQIMKNGVAVGRSYRINFIEGAGVSMTITSDGDQSTNVQVDTTAGNAVDTITFAGNVA